MAKPRAKTTWTVDPLVGLGPIKLGATRAAVVDLLGKPDGGERGALVYDRLDLRVDLERGKVAEISVATRCRHRIEFAGLDVFAAPRLTVMRALEAAAGKAYEAYGFVILPRIGVATTIQERAKGDRALTIFPKGGWDASMAQDRRDGELAAVSFLKKKATR
jgi:hypothetical protein